MRINELNMFQNLLSRGQDAVSGLANQFRSPGAPVNQEKVDKMARDMFVNKFVSRGAEALSTAVQQKLVDPNSTDMGGSNATPQPTGSGQAAPAGGQPGAQQPAAPATGSGQTAQPAAPAAAGQAAPAAGQATPGAATAAAGSAGAKSKAAGNNAVPIGSKQGTEKPGIDQNVDKIVSAMRQLKPAGTKILPPESKIAKEIAADLPKVSLNKDYLLRVGDKILKANNAGYDVKDLHRQFMGQHAKGVKMKSIQEERMFELLVKLITEEKFRQKVLESGHHPSIVITKYKMILENSTNEGIMDKVKGFFGKKPAAAPQGPDNLQVPPGANPTAAPAAAPAGSGKPSLGKWFKDTFMGNFLKGINLDAAMPQIQKILDNMGKSYKSGGIQKDLQNIAMIAFAQSDMGKTQDKMAPV